MIVMKFGGTSVENADAMRRVAEIVRHEKNRTPIVVLSACAGVTNELLRTAHLVRDGEKEKALSILDRLRQRHKAMSEDLLEGNHRKNVDDHLDDMFQDLRNIVRGVHLLGELTPRSLDTISGHGELLSSTIFHAFLEQQGQPTAFVDARKVMMTDRQFGAAQPLMDKIACKADEVMKPTTSSGKTIVTQGFIGATEEDGITTTIGRGGSDLTAAIFGAVMDAEEIQIWTDVDGMMSADPRLVPDARLIKAMSFAEASELAYFGAKVLHPRTILPAIQKKIPVKVLNSRRPEIEGTIILESVGQTGDVIKSIASKNGITILNVASSRMLMAQGFLARLFTIFADLKKSVDVVATSEVSVSLTLDSEDGIDEILQELNSIGETKVLRKKSIVCIVGEGMRNTPGVGARIFSALGNAKVNIEMVSEGASEINLTLVVDESQADLAVQVLHKEFFG